MNRCTRRRWDWDANEPIAHQDRAIGIGRGDEHAVVGAAQPKPVARSHSPARKRPCRLGPARLSPTVTVPIVRSASGAETGSGGRECGPWISCCSGSGWVHTHHPRHAGAGISNGGTEIRHPCRKSAQVTEGCHWSPFAWLSALKHTDAECVTSDAKLCVGGMRSSPGD